MRAVCSLPLVAIAAILVGGGIADGGVNGVFAVGGAAAVLVFVARYWRLRVEDLGHELRVTNWIRTVHVPWEEVDRFVFEDGGVRLRRRNMREYSVSAFAAPYRDPFGIAHRRNREAFLRLERMRKERLGTARRTARSRS